MSKQKRIIIFTLIGCAVGLVFLLFDQINISQYIVRLIPTQKGQELFVGIISVLKAPLFAVGGFIASISKDVVNIYIGRKDKEREESPHISLVAESTYGPRRKPPSDANIVLKTSEDNRNKECYYVFCRVQNQGNKDVLHIEINEIEITKKLLPNESSEFVIEIPHDVSKRSNYVQTLQLQSQNYINTQYIAVYEFVMNPDGDKTRIKLKKPFKMQN